MKNDINLKELYQKYADGSATEQERLLLENWYNQLGKGESSPISEERLLEAKERMWIGIESDIEPVIVKAPIRLWYRIAAAAVILVTIGVGIIYYKAEDKLTGGQAVVADIAPGRNGATLTLASGRKILINDALTGDIAAESGVRISKTADGQLIYEITGKGSRATEFNTLSTTRGEQSQVRLPDGSLVFLNSASSLRYPTSFGKERNVELSGEAYFEVAHDKARPFRVMSNGQEVKVLGTHFNVNSYADEPSVRTTLLEGSVSVAATGGAKASQVIRPGEQAALSASGNLAVEQVNAEDVVAWTNGKFIFEEESVENIMRTISRWYDVEVVYEGNVKSKKFAGTLSRKDHISKILDKITFTQAAHFKIEGRRVTVMP